MSDTIQIPKQLALALMQYLETRPYGEVHQGMQMLSQALREAEEAEQEAPDKGKQNARNAITHEAEDELARREALNIQKEQA